MSRHASGVTSHRSTLSVYSTMVIGVSFKPQIALSRRTAQLLIGWTQRLCKPDLAAFVNRQ